MLSCRIDYFKQIFMQSDMGAHLIMHKVTGISMRLSITPCMVF